MKTSQVENNFFHPACPSAADYSRKSLPAKGLKTEPAESSFEIPRQTPVTPCQSRACVSQYSDLVLSHPVTFAPFQPHSCRLFIPILLPFLQFSAALCLPLSDPHLSQINAILSNMANSKPSHFFAL